MNAESLTITAFMVEFAPPLVITALLLAFAGARITLAQRLSQNESALVDKIDNLLPQTQCAQCGYPGCRPYAQAVADQIAPLNLCPPGGTATYTALTELMGSAERQSPPADPQPAAIVVIDEARCIGCTLCLPPCPVDAIVGAQGYMHSVITKECTGCELCIPACPVDCISLIKLPQAKPAKIPRKLSQKSLVTQARPCIGCGLCEPACPENLPAQSLLSLVQRDQHELAYSAGLADCIECGLCDQVCPSEIPMAHNFIESRHQHHQELAKNAEQSRLKQRYVLHLERLANQAETSKSKREERLKAKRAW